MAAGSIKLPALLGGGSVDRRLAIAAGAAVLTLAARWLLGPSDSKAVTDAQRATAEPQAVTPAAGGAAISVRRVTPAEAAAAATTLAAGLADDARNVVCAREGSTSVERKSALTGVYRALLATVTPRSSKAVVLRTEDGSAVAVWLPGERSYFGSRLAEAAEYIWQGGLPAMMRLSGASRRGRLDLAAEAINARRALLTQPFNGRFFYLLLAAAAPGAPAGSRDAVISALLRHADAVGYACVAEVTAADAAAVAAHAALGFSTAAELTLFDVPVALMVRQPAGGKA